LNRWHSQEAPVVFNGFCNERVTTMEGSSNNYYKY
jgi:hypothetical protein